MEKLNFDDFNRIFCKGIFKEAMINVNQNFDKVESKPAGAQISAGSGNDEVSLTVKIGEF
jgi:hypothetical protein